MNEADVARMTWAAAVLNATVAGYDAENQFRMNCGNQVAYSESAYAAAIDEARAILQGART